MKRTDRLRGAGIPHRQDRIDRGIERRDRDQKNSSAARFAGKQARGQRDRVRFKIVRFKIAL